MCVRYDYICVRHDYICVRYDYEECETARASAMMSHLRAQLDNKSLIGETLSADSGERYTVQQMDDFEYVDPIDGSVTANQVCVN